MSASNIAQEIRAKSKKSQHDPEDMYCACEGCAVGMSEGGMADVAEGEKLPSFYTEDFLTNEQGRDQIDPVDPVHAMDEDNDDLNTNKKRLQSIMRKIELLSMKRK